VRAMTVLGIGVDLPSPLKRACEDRGIFVTLSPSPSEAILQLQYSDFDLCLIGRKISSESRAKLVSLLRQTLHSSIPVISVTDDCGPTQILGNLAGMSPSDAQQRRIGELFAETKQPASFAADSLNQRAIPKPG
jgi:hypothetical protein